MTSIYDLINTIKTHLRENPIINTVTFGDITEIDLNKTSMYPLAHFFINNVSISNSMQMTISMLFIDIVDYTKEFNDNDAGDRGDASNLIDVYNTQLQLANGLIQQVRRGQLYQDGYQLEGIPVCEPFNDRFENNVAGWTVELTINVGSAATDTSIGGICS